MSYNLQWLDEEIAELKANFAMKLAQLEAQRLELIAAAIKEADENVAAATAAAAALRASFMPVASSAFLLPPEALIAPAAKPAAQPEALIAPAAKPAAQPAAHPVAQPDALLLPPATKPAAQPDALIAPAAQPAAAPDALPAFFTLILASGNAVGVKEEGKTAPLRSVEASKAQLFKAVHISSGPHAGYMELEAVGGRQDGKVLDNSAKKNTSIVFFRRCLVNNAAQRWKLVDGKLSSAVSGLFMAKGEAPGFGFSETGDVFTFAAAAAPAAPAPAPEPVAEPKPKEKRLVSAGTLAWGAFVKHVKATMPERFVGLKKGSEMLIMAKTIKEGNMEAYATFAAEFKVALAHQPQQQQQQEVSI
jgi:hypothetical protein